MAGLSKRSARPVELCLHTQTQILEVCFDDGAHFELPSEYLRVYSPSAEVRGHGVGNAVLQSGKRHVVLTALEPVGHYAVKLVFDDGHHSGLYSWDYLYELGSQQTKNWQHYLDRLAAAGASRDE